MKKILLLVVVLSVLMAGCNTAPSEPALPEGFSFENGVLMIDCIVEEIQDTQITFGMEEIYIDSSVSKLCDLASMFYE